MVVDLGILGPLTVRIDGRERRVPPGGQQTLLTVLVVHVGTTVSADRLVEVVWGDDRPQHAGNALQGRISQLRKILAGDGGRSLVRQRGSGYWLDVPPVTVDARRFERSCEVAYAALGAGRADEAAAGFDDALGMWRGAALEDVADQTWALPEITRLEELRLLAIEGKAAARLTLGESSTIIAPLEELLAVHPLREGLRAHLMVALYRAGRQAEALATYQAGRDLLAEELGIDPGPQLRELHERILQQDPELLAGAEPAVQVGGQATAGAPSQERTSAREPCGEPAIRVLLVDDHAVVRRGLAAFFDQIDDIVVTGQAADGREALRVVEALAREGGAPDVVLMDLLMPEMDGITATALIREAHPDVRVVAVTSFAEGEKIRDALGAGASGYVLKHAEADEVARAIRAAHRGAVQLDGHAARVLQQVLAVPRAPSAPAFTEREEEVLELLAEGASNAEIADVLSISERTARGHLSSILAKLGVDSRTQAALWAARQGRGGSRVTAP